MTTVQTTLPSREWAAPENLRVRGSVVVLGGRGETPDVYNRFGTRISADSYAVIAYAGAFGTEADVAREIAARIAAGELTAPVIIVGSDVGAVAAVDVAAQLGAAAAAVILAGYPVAQASIAVEDWESELLERTTCPVHRGVLAADADVLHGSFSDSLDARRIERDLSTLTVPVVAIHGGADLVSPFDEVLPLYASAPDAQVWVIEGAKHDVLNDSTHRTTAAVIVQFLETLRAGVDASLARRVK